MFLEKKIRKTSALAPTPTSLPFAPLATGGRGEGEEGRGEDWMPDFLLSFFPS